ncbi:MAG: hypothetical protein QNJ90_06995 [Planctomycetota bacterium]|nr:hypothetical protein [Planctomycetota bacterium]
MTTPEDRELEALLREQTLLPLPLALVGRILDEVLPVEPVRPWALVGRAAAAIVVFCASWLALSGDVPAFADVAPETHVAAALPAQLPAAPATTKVLDVATATPDGHPALWLGLGLALLAGGLVGGWRLHRRAAEGGAQ